MLYLIITISISMSISFLCSLFEACLLSLSHNDIAAMSLKKPKKAAIWKKFKGNIQKPIAVILIINTVAHTIGASLSGAQFDELFGPQWILIYSLAFSFAMIQWTEILPKTLGVKYNTRLASLITIPLLFLQRVFTPIVKLIELINMPFVGRKREQDKFDIINEISVLSKYAFTNSLITKDQEKIITRTVKLANIRAKDIMVQKKDIKCLTSKMTMMDALIEAHIHNHTRFPLLDAENKNDVLGYINFKDIVSALKINPGNPSLSGIVRPVIAIFEEETYPDIFKIITSKHQHIAVVKDKNGILTGLITIEDLIEEIVGDIEDEYDVLPTHLYPITNNRFIIGGGVKIGIINQECGLNLEHIDLTINDWIHTKTGGSIQSGNSYVYDEVSVIVKKISRGRIRELILEKKQ